MNSEVSLSEKIAVRNIFALLVAKQTAFQTGPHGQVVSAKRTDSVLCLGFTFLKETVAFPQANGEG